MIQQLIDRFMANKNSVRAAFAASHPNDYVDVVKIAVESVTDNDYGENSLDPQRIHQIDDGDRQGTLVFVIGAKGYQPSRYWYTMVRYGTCSGCDALQSICGYRKDAPTDEQINDYVQLALHVVQGMKRMRDDD